MRRLAARPFPACDRRNNDGRAVASCRDDVADARREDVDGERLRENVHVPVEMAVATGQPESVKPEEAADAESGHDEHTDHDH